MAMAATLQVQEAMLSQGHNFFHVGLPRKHARETHYAQFAVTVGQFLTTVFTGLDYSCDYLADFLETRTNTGSPDGAAGRPDATTHLHKGRFLCSVPSGRIHCEMHLQLLTV